MGAIITCSENLRSEIRKELHGLTEYFAQIDIMEDEYEEALQIEDTEDGLSVDFPCGEIYGASSSYVWGVAHFFADLKKKYPAIGIEGIAYEYETTFACTDGPYFYCNSNDAELKIVNKWQECAMCHAILEEETCYNSDQWDQNEGNTLCLCSPICMLEYVLEQKWFINMGINNSWSEEERDIIEGSDDSDKVLKEYLWQRIVSNLDEYLPNFSQNENRIRNLIDLPEMPADKKAVLLNILDRISDFKSSK